MRAGTDRAPKNPRDRPFGSGDPKRRIRRLTGRSGCGKSTLFKLLMCLYPLDAGRRYLRARRNGKTEEYPLTALWRGLFAYVPQGNQIMSGTIREVVAFGDPSAMAQDDRLLRALQVACADSFVLKGERGLDASWESGEPVCPKDRCSGSP